MEEFLHCVSKNWIDCSSFFVRNVSFVTDANYTRRLWTNEKISFFLSLTPLIAALAIRYSTELANFCIEFYRMHVKFVVRWKQFGEGEF